MKKHAVRVRVRKPQNHPSKTGHTELFRNIHEGKTGFVFGAGTSLGNQDLSQVYKYPVVSINSSVILMPWDVPGDPLDRFWISTDLLCMQWDYFREKVLKFECTRIVRNSFSRESDQFKNVKMHYYLPRRSSQSPNWKDEGLMAGSSILSGIDLALLMGLKKIILLGVDHRNICGHSHFWQNWPVKERPKREGKPGNFFPCQRQQGRVFKSNLRAFDVLKKYSEQLGATIYNASGVSTVTAFEMISLEDALKL